MSAFVSAQDSCGPSVPAECVLISLPTGQKQLTLTAFSSTRGTLVIDSRNNTSGLAKHVYPDLLLSIAVRMFRVCPQVFEKVLVQLHAFTLMANR
jgi:hypothetical protein